MIVESNESLYLASESYKFSEEVFKWSSLKQIGEFNVIPILYGPLMPLASYALTVSEEMLMCSDSGLYIHNIVIGLGLFFEGYVFMVQYALKKDLKNYKFEKDFESEEKKIEKLKTERFMYDVGMKICGTLFVIDSIYLGALHLYCKT